jgi:hypothetical protein
MGPLPRQFYAMLPTLVPRSLCYCAAFPQDADKALVATSRLVYCIIHAQQL